MNYKKTIVAAVIAVVFLAPAIIFAQTATEKRNQALENARKVFCEKAANFYGKLNQRLDERGAKLEERKTEREQNMEGRRDNRDAKREEARDRWQERRSDFYQKLEERAQNDAQKQALVIFKQKVEAAIIARKTAIDAAKQIFRDGLDKLIAERKAAVDTAKNALRNATRTAHENASLECQNGEPQTIRETLRTRLKEAREKFEADRQAIEKLKDGVKPLIEARKAAVEKAISDFKAAMESARTELKTAWEENQ